jgi:hypothetical protein
LNITPEMKSCEYIPRFAVHLPTKHDNHLGPYSQNFIFFLTYEWAQ